MAKTLWVDTLHNLVVAEAGQTFTSLMTGLASAATRLEGMTLLRTICRWDIAFTVHDSGEGSQMVDIGLGVTSQEAMTVGVIPDPNSDTDYPTRGWIYRGRWRVFGFAADDPAIDVARIDLDLRSRRRLDNGEAYLVANNNNVDGSSSSISVVGVTRQLWLVT